MADSNLNIQQKVKFTLETELDKQSKLQVGKQLRDILSDAVITFDKAESERNLKPVVDMINKVFEKADMQIIDEGSVEASFKKIAEMSADTFQAAFEAAVKNNGGIRLSFTDFKLDDIVNVLGKIEKKIGKKTGDIMHGAAQAVKEDVKDINGAIERLGKNAASYKAIRDTLKYRGEDGATYKKQGEKTIQGLYQDYESAATWEAKQQALIKYVKAYEAYIDYLNFDGKKTEAIALQSSEYGEAFKEMQAQFAAAKQGLEDILIVKNKNDLVSKIRSTLKFDGSNRTQKDDMVRLQELSDAYVDSLTKNEPWELQHQSLLKFVRAYDKYVADMSDDARVTFESQNQNLTALHNLVAPSAKAVELELRAIVDDADYRNTYELSDDRSKPWAREKTLQEVKNILKGGLKVEATSGGDNNNLPEESVINSPPKKQNNNASQKKSASQLKQYLLDVLKDTKIDEIYKSSKSGKTKEDILYKNIVAGLTLSKDISKDGEDEIRAAVRMFQNMEGDAVADLVDVLKPFVSSLQNSSTAQTVSNATKTSVADTNPQQSVVVDEGRLKSILSSVTYTVQDVQDFNIKTLAEEAKELSISGTDEDLARADEIQDILTKGLSEKYANEANSKFNDFVEDEITVEELVRWLKSVINSQGDGRSQVDNTTEHDSVGFDESLLNRITENTYKVSIVDGEANTDDSSIDNKIIELLNSLVIDNKNERGAFLNTKTGSYTGLVRGDAHSIATSTKDWEDASKQGYDARIHYHTQKVAAPSGDNSDGKGSDFHTWVKAWENDIKKQLIVTQNEILAFDFSGTTKEQLEAIRDAYEQEVVEIKAASKDDESLQVLMRQSIEKIMQPYVGVMKSYEFPNAVSDTLKEKTGATVAQTVNASIDANELNAAIEIATSDLAKDQTINNAKDAIISAISGGSSTVEPQIDKDVQREIKLETGNQDQRFERINDIASNYEDVDDIEAAIKQFGEVYKQIVLMSDDGYKYIKPNKTGINTLRKIAMGDFDVSDYSGIEFQRVDKPSSVVTKTTIDSTEITNAIKESAVDTSDLAKEETLGTVDASLKTIAENTKSTETPNTVNVVSPAEANQIAQEQTLQQIFGALQNSAADNDDASPEQESQEDNGEKMRTAIMHELAKYGTLEDALKAGGKRIQFDGSEVHFGSFVSEYLDKFLGQDFDRGIYEELWKEARQQFYKFEPVELTKEDAINIIREKMPDNILDGWFRKGDSEYKTKLESITMSDDELRNAALNIMWSNFKEYSGKDIGFNEFLNSEIPVYRGKKSENYVNGDELLAFSFDENMAKRFGEHVLKTLIKPIDTLGAFQTTAEAETLVYRNQLEDRDEYQQWHAAMAGADNANKINEAIEKSKQVISVQKDWLKYLDAVLDDGNFKTSGKKEASDQLRKHTRSLVDYRMHPEQYPDNGLGEEKRIVAWNKAYEEAQKQGVAQSTLNHNYTDAATDYANALSKLQTERALHAEILAREEEALRNLTQTENMAAEARRQSVDEIARENAIENSDNTQSEINEKRAAAAATEARTDAQRELNAALANEPDATPADTDIPVTATAIVPTNVDEAAETRDMTTLLSAVQAVTEAVKLKTRAFWTEKTAVDQAVAGEVEALDELENKLTGIKQTLEGLLNNIGSGGSDLAAGLSNINVTVNNPESSKVDFEDGAIERLIGAINGINQNQTGAQTTAVGNALATENTLLSIKAAVEAINSKTVKGTKVGGTGSGHKKTTKSDYTGSPFFSEKLKTREMELAKFAQQLMNSGRDTEQMKTAIKKLQDNLKLVNSGASLSVWDQLFRQTKLADNIGKLRDEPEAKEKIEDYKQLIDFAKKYYRLVEKYEKAKDGTERKNTLGRQKSDVEAFLAQMGIDFDTMSLGDDTYNKKLSDLRASHKNSMAEIEAAKFDKELAKKEAAAEKKQTEELKKQEKIVAHINELHKQLGEYQALAENSSDDMRTYYEEKIRDLEAQIASEKKKDTSLVPASQKASAYEKTRTDAKSAAEDKILQSMFKAESAQKQADVKKLVATYEKLATQRALFEKTGNLEAEQEAEHLRGIIASEQQRLGLTHEQIDALRRREEIVFEEQKAALDTKQREQNRKAYIKEEEKSQKAALRKQVQQSRAQARVGQARTAINSADDLIYNASTIEGVDAAELLIVQQLNSELSTLRDMYNKIQASDGPVDPKDQEALVNQTRSVRTHSAELKKMLQQYEALSGDNVVDTKITFDANRGNLEKQLTNAAKAATNGRARVKEFDAATGELTVSVETARNTFTEYTYAVRQYDNAIVQVQGSSKKTEGFFDAMGRKVKEVLTYFGGSSIIYRFFGEIKRGIQYVREIDSAMTELKKVTNETEKSYDKFMKTASKTAAKVGSTMQEVISSTADFSRLGSTFAETSVRPVI